MAIFTNKATPQNENNVGQFGPTSESIGAYKQAAQYAADAEYWAMLSKGTISDADQLMQVVAQLFAEGKILKDDITNLQNAFLVNDQRLSLIISQSSSAIGNANNAADAANRAVQDLVKELDIIKNMSVVVSMVGSNASASGSYNNGVFTFEIPEGRPGDIKDLGSVQTGTPEGTDSAFFIDSTDNSLKRAPLIEVAGIIPSVRGIKFPDGTTESNSSTNTNPIEITLDKLGLGAGVATPAQVDGPAKVYDTLAEATADLPNRKLNEKVLVWTGTDSSYEWYTVGGTVSSKALAIDRSEPKFRTVNGNAPDSAGNVQVTLPSGNPSLWLGEVVMFPFNPKHSVSTGANGYKGVLPADGAEYNRSAYPDLVAALTAGTIPWVTEAEWQAGNKTVFSQGTSNTKFRVPDWTEGAVLSTPDANGIGASSVTGEDKDYKGAIKDATYDDLAVQVIKGEIAPLTDLNTIAPNSGSLGVWSNSGSWTNVLPSGKNYMDYNFPSNTYLGVLEVFNGGRFKGTQRWTDLDGNIYVRSLNAGWNGTNGPWSTWRNVQFAARPLSQNMDLNDLFNLGDIGLWRNSSANIGAISRNFPVEGVTGQGILEILQGGRNGITQRYTTYMGRVFVRGIQTAASGNTPTVWTPWVEVGRSNGPVSVNTDLDVLGGNEFLGQWACLNSTAATVANHYPITGSDGIGVLEVLEGGNIFLQRFTSRYGQVFTRTINGASWNPTTPNWTPWRNVATTNMTILDSPTATPISLSSPENFYGQHVYTVTGVFTDQPEGTTGSAAMIVSYKRLYAAGASLTQYYYSSGGTIFYRVGSLVGSNSNWTGVNWQGGDSHGWTVIYTGETLQNSLGIGGNSPNKTNAQKQDPNDSSITLNYFDWNTYRWLTGEHFTVDASEWDNAPAGMSFNNNVNVSLSVLQAAMVPVGATSGASYATILVTPITVVKTPKIDASYIVQLRKTANGPITSSVVHKLWTDQTFPKGAAVADLTGTNPVTVAQFNTLLKSLRDAGIIAS